MEVCDWGGKVCKLDVVAAFGDVPGLDLAVLMSGEEGGAVVADVEAKRGGSCCRGQSPSVRGGWLGRSRL